MANKVTQKKEHTPDADEATLDFELIRLLFSQATRATHPTTRNFKLSRLIPQQVRFLGEQLTHYVVYYLVRFDFVPRMNRRRESNLIPPRCDNKKYNCLITDAKYVIMRWLNEQQGCNSYDFILIGNYGNPSYALKGLDAEKNNYREINME